LLRRQLDLAYDPRVYLINGQTNFFKFEIKKNANLNP
jgi:hypothetical protein